MTAQGISMLRPPKGPNCDAVEESSRRGMFIVLEGIDGTGKTTLAASVARMLGPEFDVRFQRRQHVPAADVSVTSAMTALHDLLWDRGDCSGDHMLPSSFWLHAQAAWHAASMRHAITPELSCRDALIVDGWYFKFFAKMLLRGHSREHLDWTFAEAGAPDLVILIDRDPEEAWERRGSFNKSEMGLHQGYRDLGRASFVAYQQDVRSAFREIADRASWIVFRPPPASPVESDAAWLSRTIEASLRDWLVTQPPLAVLGGSTRGK